MDDGELFIRDLPQSVSGGLRKGVTGRSRARAAGVPDVPVTTLACGEEGGITTWMEGEEGC